MKHQLIAYIKFILRSTNQHGVHSPFVYNLVTKCFYKKTPEKLSQQITAYRKQLLQNKEFITVTDFGSGSKIFKDNQRRIDQIAQKVAISPKRAELLIRIVAYFKPANALEIGTSLGIATTSMHLGNPHTKITTLEGCPETSAVAQKMFAKNNFKNINPIITEFAKYLNTLKRTSSKFDLIFFDGNHTKEATLNYFETLLCTTTNDSVWIFDDIHWSKEMTEAWEIIKEKPEVTVTIDTFYWGFVFFRKEQVKQNFTVRL